MERTPHVRRGGGTERWLRLLRDGGIALVGVAALAGLARDLSATRGPVVAWIIATLLGGAAGLFAWSLLEVRDAERRSPAFHTPRARREAADDYPAGVLDPHPAIPLMPSGLFPPSRHPSSTSRKAKQHPHTHRASRERRMRTRRTPPACAGSAHTQRHTAHAPRHLPPANI